MKDYYAYRMHYRRSEGSTILIGGKLFQQYAVDSYATVEQDRLRWIRSNQGTIRNDLYQGLCDALHGGEKDTSDIGSRIILPSSFTGGLRYAMQNYQDAMAICEWAGPPDLFITFTCNPNWVEITDYLKFIPGQQPADRPDIVARVFNIKLRNFMALLIKKKLFGQTIAGA